MNLMFGVIIVQGHIWFDRYESRTGQSISKGKFVQRKAGVEYFHSACAQRNNVYTPAFRSDDSR